MIKKTILVIEDEKKIAAVLEKYLEREGFKVVVLGEGINVLRTIEEVDPALCILDLMLPDIDGLSICESLRNFSNIPIIILTAKNDEEDRLSGLRLGADDYICKPFSPREVVARVQAILRRTGTKQEKKVVKEIHYNGISLFFESFECHINDKEIDLTPQEFKMLEVFLAMPKKVFSREDLMDACYKDERIVSNRTIDTHIKNLRKKLFTHSGEKKIVSIYGIGYKLV
jgi:two-component system response regulator BaeR